MPDLSIDELVLLELDAAWEAFCDANADSMRHLQEMSESAHILLELAFKAGYTSGAAMQLMHIRKLSPLGIDLLLQQRGSNDE